mmetsp:Transcript_47/g.97  ORF Transcript_47/g.97 Transcript_47/m.97 type:complete len:102 (-) Transcript_47:45-350(-)
MNVDVASGIHCLAGSFERFGLVDTNRSREMRHLSVEVAHCDLIVVDDAKRADATGAEVKSDWAPEAACAHDKDGGIKEFLLSFCTQLGQDYLPTKSLDLLR